MSNTQHRWAVGYTEDARRMQLGFTHGGCPEPTERGSQMVHEAWARAATAALVWLLSPSEEHVRKSGVYGRAGRKLATAAILTTGRKRAALTAMADVCVQIARDYYHRGGAPLAPPTDEERTWPCGCHRTRIGSGWAWFACKEHGSGCGVEPGA